MDRGLENASPPTIQEPVRYSTVRRLEVKASWVRFTSAIEMPKVSRSEESSGAPTTRNTSARCSRRPTTNSAAIDRGTVRNGFIPSWLCRKYVT